MHLALGVDEDVPGVGHGDHLHPGQLVQQLGQTLERLKKRNTVSIKQIKVYLQQ